ncbi:PadR family transcriptional regulator [Paractinoplanes abujensis]|uniref:DNA-binding PadR family transcriptional regulator n=1 Tax=Paractinoplanes abujensis TaxID=882441 RepID=A0A7W7CUQ7_9ACTN|nr:PadR family transcriptional regulator [Actinoplanes abujensis]MBB4694789.1 DNA-binding PadR family transcriptional regulator [Actinoplanes abujensis]GID23519.1 PadR family transcriptional regulator [Actinoplanes abujensis]
MSLRHALLAALSQGEASGYELAKRFDVAVADYWTATPQQLYRDLERLEQDGLVQARVVEQTRRPNKRVFTMTEKGLEELRAFGRRPSKPPAMRDELLVKLQAADRTGEPETLIEAARARAARSAQKLIRYEQLRDRLLDGRSEDEYLRNSDEVGPYLTLMAGREYEQLNISWAQTVIETLERRRTSRPDAD